MADASPTDTFRSLPLTPERDAEIRHRTKRQKQHGVPWDTRELKAMLRDMLEPAGDDDGEPDDAIDQQRRPRNAQQPLSTRPWNPSRPAKNKAQQWKPRGYGGPAVEFRATPWTG
jgi:hypothetical protein